MDFQNSEIIPDTVGRVWLPKFKLQVVSTIEDGVVLSCMELYEARAHVWGMVLGIKEKKLGG